MGMIIRDLEERSTGSGLPTYIILLYYPDHFCYRLLTLKRPELSMLFGILIASLILKYG